MNQQLLEDTTEKPVALLAAPEEKPPATLMVGEGNDEAVEPGASYVLILEEKVRSLQTQLEFFTNVTKLLGQAVQWPQHSAKDIDALTAVARSLGNRGKKLTKYLDGVNLGLRAMEDFNQRVMAAGRRAHG
jgi:hypothetical protein